MNKSLLNTKQISLLPGIITLFIFLCALIPSSLYATSMGDALKNAVSTLKSRGLSSQDDFELVLEMVNYDSKKLDREARIIQGNLFTILQNGFPKAKIILQNETIAGISGKAVYLKGTYQQQGEKINIVLQAINQTSGQLIAKADAEYDSDIKVADNMVAVLNLQATNLSKAQVRIFSKVFRSELTKTGKMNLIASEYIDNADADKIQEEYQCSRDECGTIIAQQLNASQVVTPLYEKVTENLCYLVASWKDIASGRTFNEVSIEHDCNLETLGKAIEDLACKLANTCGSQPLITPIEVTKPKRIHDEPIRRSEPDQVSPILKSEPEPKQDSVVLLSFATPLSYTFSDIKVVNNRTYAESSYSFDPDGSPSGYYIHIGFGGTSKSIIGFSWMSLVQPLVSTENYELNINAFDVDWNALIGGHFLLGLGGGLNWSNITCNSCTFTSDVGFQLLGKIGFVGPGIGLVYSIHIIASSADLQDNTYSWSGTASMLAIVVSF
ncbi:hypothetical protein KKA14_14415 [bacterium]|nr:hypothetical protein [bacterium]